VLDEQAAKLLGSGGAAEGRVQSVAYQTLVAACGWLRSARLEAARSDCCSDPVCEIFVGEGVRALCRALWRSSRLVRRKLRPAVCDQLFKFKFDIQ
jgi:hypothetical protein